MASRSSLGDVQLGHPGDYRDNVLPQTIQPQFHDQQVYMVCMPGEPTYPILAICPPPKTFAEAIEHSGDGSPLAGQDNAVKASTVGRSQSLQATGAEHHRPCPLVPEETVEPDSGFLLQWKQPDAGGDRRISGSGHDEEVDNGDPGGVTQASRAGEEQKRGEGTAAAAAAVENEGVKPSNSTTVIGDGSRQSSPNEVIYSTMVLGLHQPGRRSLLCISHRRHEITLMSALIALCKQLPMYVFNFGSSILSFKRSWKIL